MIYQLTSCIFRCVCHFIWQVTSHFWLPVFHAFCRNQRYEKVWGCLPISVFLPVDVHELVCLATASLPHTVWCLPATCFSTRWWTQADGSGMQQGQSFCCHWCSWCSVSLYPGITWMPADHLSKYKFTYVQLWYSVLAAVMSWKCIWELYENAEKGDLWSGELACVFCAVLWHLRRLTVSTDWIEPVMHWPPLSLLLILIAGYKNCMAKWYVSC